MSANYYELGTPIPEKLFLEVKAVSPKIVSVGSDGLIEVSAPLTPAEIIAVKGVLARFSLYGSYDPNLIYNMTPTQIDTFIDTNITDLPSARKILKVLAHAILFTLQRDLE